MRIEKNYIITLSDNDLEMLKGELQAMDLQLSKKKAVSRDLIFAVGSLKDEIESGCKSLTKYRLGWIEKDIRNFKRANRDWFKSTFKITSKLHELLYEEASILDF